MLSEDSQWAIIKSFFDYNGVISHHIESYNQFVTFTIQEIVDQEPIININNYSVQFKNISIDKPQVIEENREVSLIYPMDARRRDLNYMSPVYCDIQEKFLNGNKEETKQHIRVLIGNIPVMLNSCLCNLTTLSEAEKIEKGECPNDPGGYFIIKGNERVLVGQMRANYNQIIVLKQKDGEKYNYIAETRSMSSETAHSVLIKAMIESDERTVLFSIPHIKQPIPAGIVFKALGFLTSEEITSIIGVHPKTKDYLRALLRDALVCKTQEDAISYISKFPLNAIPDDDKKRKNYGWQVIENEILPHLGVSSSLWESALFLGTMIRKLLYTAVGIRVQDDRDHYLNKRIDSAGPLLAEIFRNSYKRFLSAISEAIENRKQKPDILSIISRTKSITKNLLHCMATGNWGIQKNASWLKTGVSQVLDRMTFAATLSHLRRIVIPVGKEGKNADIRKLHASSFGFICPAETPEGKNIGLVLNMSLLTKISKKVSTVVIRELFEKRIPEVVPVSKIKLSHIKDSTPVFLNNVILGYTQYIDEVLEKVGKMKKVGLIDHEVTIGYDPVNNEIKIFCDEARLIRPILTLEENKISLPNKKKYSWEKLLRDGYIEYVDCNSLEYKEIAMQENILKIQDCNYCEINPCVMLGITAAMIPFPDHTQSPRNCYQSSMGKQALGVPLFSYNLRTDTQLYILNYAQQPIVRTKIAEILKTDEMPSGINAIVAVACYSGYNQEDSIILNQSSVERGMFQLMCKHTLDCTEKKRDTYSTEQICLPPESTPDLKEDAPGYFLRKNNCNYSLLDERGIVRTRIHGKAVSVKKGDVIVGKIVVEGCKTGEEKKRDVSLVVDSGEEGTIDRVYETISPNGYRIVKVVIRVCRNTVLGDKLASREAQKGTIGMVYKQEDMPFTSSGLVPDLIMNSLALPSRMTTNQLIECIVGKEAVMNAKYADASPFTENSTNVADKIRDKIASEITKYGFNSYGWETMYNGTTGEMIEAQIYIGPTYYQKLKHMVDDKMHARAVGSVTTLTRQPLEGRALGGGGKFGEMEKDTLLGHSSSRLLRERLFEVSDYYKVPICTKCGYMPSSTKECTVCKTDQIRICGMPYASKLLFQELAALGLKIQLSPSEN